MSYLVLARKYRSATFDQVVGQNHVAQTLKKAIESGRIAHAYLFCGTRGTGKTSMARILAKALNCDTSKAATSEPCLECISCKAIARGEDMDVIEIDAASNRGIDNVREIIANAQYRPARARFKVYIIDEVHGLSKDAFNALLKVLEEPPSHVKFILATTEPEKVLPTILSRCQRYDFRNIPTREIAGHLKSICKEEEIQADEEALMLVAKAGAGSMRDALSLLDRLLSIGEKHLTVQTLEQLLGLPRSGLILELVGYIGQGSVKETLGLADRMVRDGLSPDALLASVIDHFRNLLILRTCGADSGLVEIAGLSPAEMMRQAERFEPVVLTQDITILEDLRRQLRTTQAGRALLDATLVRLALAEQFTSIADLLARVDSGFSTQKKKPEPAVGAGSAAGEAAVSSATSNDDDDDLPRPGKVWEGSSESLSTLMARHAASAGEAASAAAVGVSNLQPVDAGDLPAVWGNLLKLLQEQSASLHSLVASGRLMGIVDDQAVIRYDAAHETFPKMLGRNGKKEQLGELFSRVVGRNVGVRFEIEVVADSSAPAAPGGAVASHAAVQRPRSAAVSGSQPSGRITPEQALEFAKNPLVSVLIKELDATIVKLSEE
jgi:DNA polymerase-3 subunit gamma/tau